MNLLCRLDIHRFVMRSYAGRGPWRWCETQVCRRNGCDAVRQAVPALPRGDAAPRPPRTCEHGKVLTMTDKRPLPDHIARAIVSLATARMPDHTERDGAALQYVQDGGTDGWGDAWNAAWAAATEHAAQIAEGEFLSRDRPAETWGVAEAIRKNTPRTA